MERKRHQRPSRLLRSQRAGLIIVALCVSSSPSNFFPCKLTCSALSPHDPLSLAPAGQPNRKGQGNILPAPGNRGICATVSALYWVRGLCPPRWLQQEGNERRSRGRLPSLGRRHPCPSLMCGRKKKMEAVWARGEERTRSTATRGSGSGAAAVRLPAVRGPGSL